MWYSWKRSVAICEVIGRQSAYAQVLTPGLSAVIVSAATMIPKVPAPTWPAFFPPGVPPEDAISATGLAFRLVRTIPPVADDFLATVKEYPDRTYEGEEFVNACATSFHTDLEASTRTRGRYKGLRTRRIARGVLGAELGAQKPTGGRCHLSVWLFVEARPHLAFATDGEI